MSDAHKTGLERSESNGATTGSHTPSGIRVKPLDLCYVLQHAMQAGKDGVEWVDYDPTENAAYRRITECLDNIDSIEPIPHTVDATGWRDISTAPKDGAVFIAWETDPRESHGLDAGVYQCAWRKGDWRGPEGEQRRPTHWAPLPPPPGEEVSR